MREQLIGRVPRRDFIRAGAIALAGSMLPVLQGSTSALPSLALKSAEEQIRPRRLAYPRSKILSRLEWLGPSSKFPGTGSDMHWWTWGADDSLYVVDDDGRDFDSGPSWKNLLRVTGNPPNHRLELISQFPGLEQPGPPVGANGVRRIWNDEENPDRTRYVCGALAVRNRLYVAVYDYNDTKAGKAYLADSGPVHRLVPTGTATQKGLDHWGSYLFMDRISRHAGIVAFIYSDDGGKTWNNIPSNVQPTKDKPYFLGPRYTGLQFVGFGPGYAGVPPEFEGYVYAISNDSNWASGDHVYLARVPLDKVLERRAWLFYAGAGEGHKATPPIWVSREGGAKPILTDPGHVGHPDMTYDKPLGRYLLSVFSDAVPHSVATDPEVAFQTWDKRAELQIYEGPTAWGPWAVVHNDPAWEGPDHVPYLPHIPSKWLSADGLTGTLLFSGDYTEVGPTPINSSKSYLGFMTRPFRLVPQGQDGSQGSKASE